MDSYKRFLIFTFSRGWAKIANYLYLTKELGKDNNEERKKELMEAIRNDSVMRWSHFNLQGEYDFSDEKMVDSIGL